MNKNYDRWVTTRILNAFEEAKQINGADCLQAQLEFNETVEDQDPQFKRCSIPLVVRALSESEAFRRNNIIFGGNLDDAETYFFHTKFEHTPKYKSQYKLDEEAEMVAIVAESVRKEIDSLFQDQSGRNIYFHGIDKTSDGDLILYYHM